MLPQSAWFRLNVPPILLELLRDDQEALARVQTNAPTYLGWTLLDLARDPGAAAQWLEFLSFAIPQAPLSKAQLYQDLWALWETGKKRGGYFVEFGACDGVSLSNTYLLEKEWGWTGILAEPNPAFHKALGENRSCHISHRCVWTESGRTLPFKAVSEGEYSTLVGVDPMDFHETTGRRNDFTEVAVETISLGDLLDQAGAPDEIDYLSLDTEGSELDILQAYDFTRRRIKLITVEHNFTPRRDEIAQLLERNGYERRLGWRTQWDDWFMLRT